MVSAEDLSGGIGKVGSAAKQAGISIQELEGQLTAIVSATGISGTEAGTAIKSFIGKIFGSEKAQQELNAIKVSVRDLNTGALKQTSTILNEVASKWETLTEEQKLNVAEGIGGTYHYSKFVALMDNYNIALDATNKALNSNGSAMKENEKYIDSIQGRINIFKNTLQETYATLLSSEDFKGLVNLGTDFLNVINKITKEIGLIPTLISGILSSMVLLKKEWSAISFDKLENGKLGIGGFIGDKIPSIINSFKTISKESSNLGKEWQKLNTQSQYVNGEWAKMPTTMDKISNGFKVLKSTTIAQTVATWGLQAANVALNAVIGLGIGLAISGAIKLITDFTNRVENNREVLKKSVEATQEMYDSLKQNTEYLEELKKESTTKERLNEINKSILDKYPDLIGYYDKEAKAFTVNVEALEKKIAIQERESLIKSANNYKQAKEQKELAEKEIENNEKLLESRKKTIYGSVKDKKLTPKEIDDLITKNSTLRSTVDNSNRSINQMVALINDKISVMTKDGKTTQEIKEYLTSLYITEEQYNLAVKMSTDSIKKQTSVMNEMGNVTNEVSVHFKTLKDTANSSIESMKDINGVLEDVSNNENYNLESVIKLSEKYPQLLSVLGNRKALEQELIKIKNDQLSTTTNNLNIELQAMQKSLEVKSSIYGLELDMLLKINQSKEEFVLGILSKATGTLGLDKVDTDLRQIYDDSKKLKEAKGFIDGIGKSLKNVGIKETKKSSEKSSEKSSDIEVKIDQYSKLSGILEQVVSKISLLNEQEKNAKDPEKINLLKKEILLLEDKKNAISAIYKQQELEQKQIRNKLSSSGFLFDSTGQISNMELLTKKAEQANKVTGDARKKAQDQVKDLEDSTKRYNDLTNKLLIDSSKDWHSVGNEIQGAKNQIEDLIKKSLTTELEETLFGKDGMNIYSKKVENRIKELKDDLEKAIKKEDSDFIKIEDNIMAQIDLYQKELESLEEKLKLEDEEVQRQEKLLAIQEAQLNIEKAQKELENVKSERNVRLFENGEWKWVADPLKVKDAQEKVVDSQNILKEKQKDYMNWEKETTVNHQKEMLQNKIKFEENRLQIEKENSDKRKELLNLEYEARIKTEEDKLDATKLAFENMKNELEKQNSDLSILTSNGLDNLKSIYGNKWDEILTVLKDKVSQAQLLMSSFGISLTNSDTNISENNLPKTTEVALKKDTFAYDKSGKPVKQFYGNEAITTIGVENGKGVIDINGQKAYIDLSELKARDKDTVLKSPKRYKDGGMIDYTGWAYVDGTKADPETMLNGTMTKNVKDFVDNPMKYLQGFGEKVFNKKINSIQNNQNNENVYNITVEKVMTNDAKNFVKNLVANNI